ncbi:MAG: 4-hydroxyphenylacetate 3-hydroxylase N-terminal domain-containing protein [Candidatus Hydrogenedentota bacterium]
MAKSKTPTTDSKRTMMTPGQYRASLRDGRCLYLNGKLVQDITDSAPFRVALDYAAADFDYDNDPDIRQYVDKSGTKQNRLFQIPTNPEDLEKRFQLMSRLSPVSGAIGALFSLMNSRELLANVNADYADRIDQLYNHCKDNDLRVAQVVTDPKGDRSRGPLEQDDPDLYMHVVEKRDDGIVVRGAKLHITAASLVHEFIVLPTRRMKPGEEDYAIAFSTPVNAPGIRIINKMIEPPSDSTFDYPVSNRRRMPECFVIFDDVFVPWDRVFLCGEVELAGKLAGSLGLWERILGLAGMARRAKLLAGMAQLLADYNGIARASHVIDKVTELIFYAETLEIFMQSALREYKTTPSGMVYPNGKIINVAKYYGASNYHQMIRHIHDLCGGIVLTMPTEADYRGEDTHGDLEKYLHTTDAVPVEHRMRLYNLVRDITADTQGGWDLVTTLQSGGGLAAQKILTYRGFDMDSAREMVREAAGIE